MRFKLPILALGILISISQISQISQAATPPDLNDRIDCKRYIDETFAETVEMLNREDLPPAPNYDLLSKAVEKYYNGTNKIILDDLGYPSIMVRLDIFSSFDDQLFPTFKIKDKICKEIFVGKYEASVYHGHAYSLPNVDPQTQIGMDRAREVTLIKGRGWHVTSNMEYSLIARICYMYNFFPNGNTNTDLSEDFFLGENGRITVEKRDPNGKLLIRRMATGSGPATWSHTGDEEGIYDLNGNIWEYADGVRLVNGEIQIIPDNDVVLPECWDEWKAINKKGKLVEPGSKRTWKIDSMISSDSSVFGEIDGAVPFLSLTRKNSMYTPEDTDKDYGFGMCTFKDLTAKYKVPNIIKLLMLYPPKIKFNLKDDGLWVRNYGTRRLMRGGMWARSSGMFGGSFAGAWNDKSQGMGFRISYINLE